MQARATIDDEQLGDFRALYRRHYGMVWHALHRFGVSPSLVDDAVQDTFVVAYRRRATFTGGSPKPWLYGIARRVASNYRRTAERRARRGHDRGPDPLAPADAIPRAHEALRVLERFVEGLQPGDRELFVLSELEGMTGPEISDALGKNLHTTYSRIRKLRQGFAAELDDRVLARARRERPRATASSWAALLPSLHDVGGASQWLPWLSVPKWAALGGSVASVLVVGALATGGIPSGERATANTTEATSREGERGGARGERVTSDEVTSSAVAVVEPGAAVEADVPATTFGGAASSSIAAVEADMPATAFGGAASRSIAGAPATAINPTATPARDRGETARGAAATRPSPADREAPTAISPADRAVTSDAASASGPSSLAVENELLRRAAQELRAGRAAAALALTDDHAERFSGSALADLRAALRIESLCALGKHAQARGEAAAFLARAEGSPVTERIRRACPSQNPGAADN